MPSKFDDLKEDGKDSSVLQKTELQSERLHVARAGLLHCLNSSLPKVSLIGMGVKDSDGKLVPIKNPDGSFTIRFTGSIKSRDYYPIKWCVNVVNAGRRKFSLGYCTYGKGTAFVSSDLIEPLVVSSVEVMDNNCSDAELCLNLACPLNRANIKKYLRSYGVKSPDDLRKLYERIKEIEKTLDEIGLSFEKAGYGVTYYKKPVIHIVKS